jgi:hypothetical protein
VVYLAGRPKEPHVYFNAHISDLDAGYFLEDPDMLVGTAPSICTV